MDEISSRKEDRESFIIAGEMAAQRLFSLIHERFEELEDRAGLTQHEIAVRLGVTDQQVSRWMSEPRNMTVRSAGRLLAALEAHLCFEVDKFEHIRQAARTNSVASVMTGRPTSPVSKRRTFKIVSVDPQAREAVAVDLTAARNASISFEAA